MTCETVILPDGQRAIVCGPRQRRRKCSGCGRMTADRQCDWKVSTHKSGTCDKWVCASCTVNPGPDKDICPEHAPALRDWQARRNSSR